MVISLWLFGLTRFLPLSGWVFCSLTLSEVRLALPLNTCQNISEIVVVNLYRRSLVEVETLVNYLEIIMSLLRRSWLKGGLQLLFSYMNSSLWMTQRLQSPQITLQNPKCRMLQIIKWPVKNNTRINGTKMQEMIITNLPKESPLIPLLNINGTVIKRVQSSELMGVIISGDLKWHLHVDSHFPSKPAIVFIS